MDRATPVAHSDEIELYVRTYYSLLRSSAPIRVRSLEETHAAMSSSLHILADSQDLDVSALVYCAMRLPEVIVQTKLMVLGQMEDVFRHAGFRVERWHPVRARARRRKLYFNAEDGTLAAYVASVSDIDDLIPTVTTFQIEWNKIHGRLGGDLGNRLRHQANGDGIMPAELMDAVRAALGLDMQDFTRLTQIWPGRTLLENLRLAAVERMDMRIKVLGSGLSDYRRTVQHWWRKIEAKAGQVRLTEQPVYFVSSNTHSLLNLLSGAVWDYQDELIDYVRRENPEELASEYDAIDQQPPGALANFLYYASRLAMAAGSHGDRFRKHLEERLEKCGIIRIRDPHALDVEAQVISLSTLKRKWLDPRMRVFSDADWALLKQSDALIFNIDYPLGMAAYHVFSQVSTATDRCLGVYILGKAATLNGRVGDVMIPNVVYDEHSRNSYLFRNCFTAQDVGPYLSFGTVLDNQKAVTVRGTLLQNREFINVFYEEGYTDIEMEAGPYLSGIYEDIYPKRYPVNEIVNLFINAPYDIGLIHYASDTPISRRQTLLSKSMSYFGMDATYAGAIAVLRRILETEIERQRNLTRDEATRKAVESAMLKSNGA